MEGVSYSLSSQILKFIRSEKKISKVQIFPVFQNLSKVLAKTFTEARA